jgi:hypothetical protein
MIQRPWEPDPTDGYAYNPLELAAIWELEVDFIEMVRNHEYKYKYFEHVIAEFNHPEDIRAKEILRRALLAEHYNQAPEEPPTWPCPSKNCPNDIANIRFDHEEPNGWVHGDPDEAIT